MAPTHDTNERQGVTRPTQLTERRKPAYRPLSISASLTTRERRRHWLTRLKAETGSVCTTLFVALGLAFIGASVVAPAFLPAVKAQVEQAQQGSGTGDLNKVTPQGIMEGVLGPALESQQQQLAELDQMQELGR